MQLMQSTGLFPLSITIGISLAAPIIGANFSYNDVDQFSKIQSLVSNVDTIKYLNEIERSTYNGLLNRIRFEEYYESWEVNTKYSSMAIDIVDDSNFKSIVAMGTAAIPFIINKLEQKPSVLVWALNYIFENKITSDRDVSINVACRLWLKALKK